jgi:phosphatidylinositol alpha-1,6-mannosyltransferase
VTQVLRRASMVVASSRFTQTSVLSLGVSPDRVRILHPGANVAPEDATSAPPSPDRPFTLLSVSRLVDLYKGHDTVIRALPLIHSKCPATRYVIVGGGPLRDYLQRLAGTLGVEQHVVFLGDVSDDTREALYQNCDVFVQLSREARSGGGAEGFGIVCLEASAAGKPVVAGRAGGLPDAVKDGVSGLLVDPSNLGHVAEAIASLLLDSSRRMRMGQAGRARVLRAFTWERMAQTARALFAEAAGAK